MNAADDIIIIDVVCKPEDLVPRPATGLSLQKAMEYMEKLKQHDPEEYARMMAERARILAERERNARDDQRKGTTP